MSPPSRVEITRPAAWIALALLIAGTAKVLAPFVGAGLLAGVFVNATWPLFERIRRQLRGSDIASAAVMTLLTLVVVVVPLAWMIEAAARYLPGLIDQLRQLFERGVPPPPPWLAALPWFGPLLAGQWERIAADPGALRQLGAATLDTVRDPLLSGGRIVGGGFLELALATLFAFFFWRDGERLLTAMRSVAVQVGGAVGEELLRLADATIRAVMLGFIGTGLAQGALAAIGFALAGVPGAVVLGVVTALMSILPSGTVPVWLGVAIWLLIEQRYGAAIFVFLWGLLLVSMADNVVRPMIISRGTALSFLPVFLGVIGGAVAFGFVGLFLGPTLLALASRLIERWIGRNLDGEPPRPVR